MREPWPSAELNDLTEAGRSVTYGVVKPGEEVDGGVTFVRGGDISGGRIALGGLRTIAPQLSQTYKRTILRGGELLISLVGNPGEVAVAPPSLAGANIARQVGLIALRPECDARFAMYFLMSPRGRAELFSRTGGAVQQVINLADLKTLKIPAPGRDVQLRIADVLSAYDQLMENNRRRMGLLEKAARLLYQEWFVRFRFPGHKHSPITNVLPEGWEMCSVGSLGAVVTGKTPSTSDADNYKGDIPFIKTPDMHGNVFVVQTESSLTEKGANTQPGKFIPQNTLLVSCIGTIGVVSIASQLSQFNQQINALIPTEDEYRYYLFFMLQSLKEEMESIGGGATMGNVNKTKFEGLVIRKPQMSLLRQFHDFCSSLFQQILVLQLQNQKLRAARDLLLPRLISGEIAV